jgi:hypothetical protein
MSTLTDLKVRLDEVMEGDRGLDVMIEGLLAARDAPWSAADVAYGCESPEWHVKPPAYTSNLQDAWALAEATLPGWGWEVWNDALAHEIVGDVWSPITNGGVFIGSSKPGQPALALCRAVVAALAAKDGP